MTSKSKILGLFSLALLCASGVGSADVWEYQFSDPLSHLDFVFTRTSPVTIGSFETPAFDTCTYAGGTCAAASLHIALGSDMNLPECNPASSPCDLLTWNNGHPPGEFYGYALGDFEAAGTYTAGGTAGGILAFPGGVGTLTVTETAAPEPATLALLGLGLAGLGMVRRRRAN